MSADLAIAPITRFHTCGACGCHVPADRGYDELAARHSRVLTQLREAKQALKQARRK